MVKVALRLSSEWCQNWAAGPGPMVTSCHSSEHQDVAPLAVALAAGLKRPAMMTIRASVSTSYGPRIGRLHDDETIECFQRSPHIMTSTSGHRSKLHIIQDIEDIASQPGFMYSLAFLCYRDLFVDPEEAASRNWHESLSYQELGLLCGLLVKHTLQLVHASEHTVEYQIKKIDELFQELHNAYKPPPIESLKSGTTAAAKSLDRTPEAPNSYGMGDFFAEGIFYAGSGAYDFQYLDLAPKRYEGDTQWIVQNRGFSIKDACEIARQLKRHVEARLQGRMPPQSFTDLCDQLLSGFSFEPHEITGLPTATIDAFLKIFSLEPGTENQDFNIYGDYNAFEACPIIRLGDGRYLLLNPFLLTQSIYESPFYWMSADPAYKDTFFTNRGKATTSIAHEMMIRVFGPSRVFQDVRVMRNKHETVTDVDILAFAGNKAVVIQAKSKKLTQLARGGSEDQLLADFKAAIQDGYDQAIACRHALLDKRHTFLDNAGNEIRPEESLDDAYLVCLTSDNYPGLSLQTAHFLTRKAGSPAPIAISLLDLDVLTFYLEDPFDFVYYQRQRAATADYYRAENEVVLLAYHLNQRLWRTPGFNMEIVDSSSAQLIDAHFPAARGQYAPTDASMKLYNRWKNDGFRTLVDQLKESCIPGFTDAVFMLYEMSSEAADDLVRRIEATKLKTVRDGKRHSFSLALMKENERGISFVCQPDAEILSQDVRELGTLKKYQLRANEWLSMGSISGSTNMIDVAMFKKKPWEQDPKLDAISRILKPGTRLRTGKKVGRNALCPCGSRLKFKKCCGR